VREKRAGQLGFDREEDGDRWKREAKCHTFAEAAMRSKLMGVCPGRGASKTEDSIRTSADVRSLPNLQKLLTFPQMTAQLGMTCFTLSLHHKI
jgi:hypothetical protein